MRSPHIATVRYENPGAEFQNVRSFGRYVFGREHCDRASTQAYVLRDGESFDPEEGSDFERVPFDDFVALIDNRFR